MKKSPHLTSRRGLPKILFAAMIALHIFGVKTNLLGQQPATCNCPGLTYAFDEVVIGGNLPDFPGPFNVRLYVIFLKDPNLQNGGFVDPIAERFDLIMSNLSDVFNPQNIFFQPGFGNPCGGTDNYLEMNAPSSGTNQKAMVGFHQANITSNITYANGLTLYIMHDQVSGAGFEFSTPSTFCMVSGVFNGELGSKTSIVAHEIGHCLDLLHTFQQCTGPTTSCYYTGDLVCETPWTDQDDDITGNTDCPPASPESPNWQNIMSYFYPASCRSEFTSEQGKRMRHYLHENIGEGLGELGNIGADIHITTNTTWSTAQVVQGNIFIENNSILTVNAEVEMQENNMIFVERGSQLIVRNTITNTCGKFWKGVVVDGNHILPQNSGQGRVLMNAPGVIENALCAVRLGGFEVDPNSGTNESTGGIFTATGGTLRNNVVGVQFLPYVKEDSRSVLSGCAFVTDHQYYGKNPVFHAKMNLIYGVKFNCAFRDDRVASYSNPNTRARGIEAKNATFKVLGLSHFKNLYRAIDAARVKNPASPNVVEGASFEDCFTGIHFFNNYKYSLTGNEFSMLPPAAFTGTALMTGVKLDGMGAITFNGNSFSSSIEYVDFVGVDCYSLGESENEIKENSFSDIWIANRANGGNGGQTGLQYLCNTNSGNNHDFWVTGGSTIRAVQGEDMGQFNNIPAGNTFSHLDFDFRNDGTLKPITYVSTRITLLTQMTTTSDHELDGHLWRSGW